MLRFRLAVSTMHASLSKVQSPVNEAKSQQCPRQDDSANKISRQANSVADQQGSDNVNGRQ